MKQVKLLIACLLALCVVLPGVAVADTLDDILERGTLRVGMEPGYMPFEMTNKKGEIIGFDVDMAKRIAKAMGVELELVSTAWDGIIPALITKKFDIIMSGMTLTQERNLKISFADPYIVIGQSILVDKKLADEIKSYKDLNDKKYKVASKLGTTGEQATKRLLGNATYISYETEQEGVMELLNGKIDAFVYDLPFNAIANAEKRGGKSHDLRRRIADHHKKHSYHAEQKSRGTHRSPFPQIRGKQSLSRRDGKAAFERSPGESRRKPNASCKTSKNHERHTAV